MLCSTGGAADSCPDPRQVAHAANVPALAYVAAGKQQKKFLLLDTPPTGPVSAALVETLKYAYIYSRTAPSEAHGVQQARRPVPVCLRRTDAASGRPIAAVPSHPAKQPAHSRYLPISLTLYLLEYMSLSQSASGPITCRFSLRRSFRCVPADMSMVQCEEEHVVRGMDGLHKGMNAHPPPTTHHTIDKHVGAHIHTYAYTLT